MTDSYNKRVAFVFDDSPIFDGYTDGTKWNGFANIKVNEETHLLLLEYFASGYIYDFEKMFETEFGIGQGGEHIQPNEDGLYSYAYGFTPTIVGWEYDIDRYQKRLKYNSSTKKEYWEIIKDGEEVVGTAALSVFKDYTK